MAIYSAVDCAEEHATVTEDMGRETGIAARVTLRCAFADRFALMADLIANNRVWPNGGFTIPPLVQGASSQPFPAQYTTVGQVCVYDYALVTVNYSHKIVDVFTESLEPTAEFVTVDHLKFAWGAADGIPLLEAEAPGFLLKSCNLVRTLYNLPSLPANLLDLIGKSNDADYTSALLGLTFPEETLLFQPAMPTRTFTTTGTTGWTLQLKFSYKPQGWNKFWRAGAAGDNPGEAGNWDQIYYVESGDVYKPHPPADFSAYLF